MKSSKARQIVHFDVQLSTGVKGALFDTLALAEAIVEDVAAGKCVELIEKETILFGFHDARIVTAASGRRYLVLLALNADPGTADPTAVNTKTLKFDQFKKGPDQAFCSTAHCILSLEPKGFGSVQHAGLIEVTVGLGKSRVNPALQRVVRHTAKDRGFTVTGEDRKEVAVRPKVILDLVLDAKIREEAAEGEVRSIVLYGAVEPGEFDPPAGVEPTRKQVRLKVKQLPGETPIDFLNRLKPWARSNGFSEMYVRWDRPGAPADGGEADGSEAARINLALEDVGMMAFAKREVVVLDNPLPDGQESISDELVEKMLHYFEA